MSAIATFHWPQLPPLPPPQQPVLVRVTTATARQVARRQLRATAQQILRAWSGRAAQGLPWQETPRGPVWRDLVAGHSVAMSFSYSDGSGWIGLLRAGRIGIDAMRIRPFAEMEAVARLYLGPASWRAIQAAPNPARAFAIAWTELEARLKCLRRELGEQPEAQVAIETQCASQAVCFEDDTVVTTICLVEAV